MPGGETTTMDKLIDRFDLRQPLKDFAANKPIWGTCAGMILLGRNIEDNQSNVTPLGLMDIDTRRNDYGRQIYSFDEPLEAQLNGHPVVLTATFIRAPRVVRCGPGVEILAEFRQSPVLVSEKNLLASSFHTELDEDVTLLRYFLKNYC
jgi:5'-phosphate synthase pdxT subunit